MQMADVCCSGETQNLHRAFVTNSAKYESAARLRSLGNQYTYASSCKYVNVAMKAAKFATMIWKPVAVART